MAKWLEKEVVSPIDGIPPIEEWQSARCSACGKYHTTPYMYYFDEYAYCPSCGEPMDGKDEPQTKITYQNCADALLMMWMDNILTDAEYNRIMDKLNNAQRKTEPQERSE